MMALRSPEYAVYYGDNGHTMAFRFAEDIVIVEEENWLGIYGMNVTFAGTYKRVR